MKNNLNTPVFSQNLERLISQNNEPINKHILQKFLTIESLPTLTEDLIEDEEWNIFKLATVSIYLENKSDELLKDFFETIGTLLYQDDKNRNNIEKVILRALRYASHDQIEQTIGLLNKLDEQFTCFHAYIPAIFFEKLSNKLQLEQMDRKLVPPGFEKEMLEFEKVLSMQLQQVA
ncbi:MAG: hypothetical protein ACUZ8E_14935 [Candidatus Anammoxibacter sp.]